MFNNKITIKGKNVEIVNPFVDYNLNSDSRVRDYKVSDSSYSTKPLILLINEIKSKEIEKVEELREYLNAINRKVKIGDKITVSFKVKSIKKVYYGYFYYHGFEIISIKIENRVFTFVLKKEKDIFDIRDKKYSLLIKLPRTGKGGKRIYVYKFRTMQPYSEYLQDFIVKCNGLNSDGTIRRDFRITKIGKFLRRYWLDELPMLINFFNGDLKLIGVRPLSDTMLNAYPQEYVRIRNQFKPGLIPPYYIDKPKNFEELIESEIRYLKLYYKQPVLTDIKYFLKFLKAIFLKGVRSS